MLQYQDLLRYVLEKGVRKPTRAMLESTGKRVDAISVFGYQTRYHLGDGFPAVTTKKLAWNVMVAELLWFLRGSTNIRDLPPFVHIWDQWVKEDGDLGPIYGSQWRTWATPDGSSIDQIGNVVSGLRALSKDPTDSCGRRLVVSAWNPSDLPRMALPPCHALFQFSVSEGALSCQLYQRSADAFLGVPFNIASYALLTHLMAHVTGLRVGEFIHTFGDLHIYENHVDQVREQISRKPKQLPTLWLDPSVKEIDDFTSSHIRLLGYQHHTAIKGEVAI